MAAFTSFTGLAIFRFILGAFEASISPSMLVVVAMWWTRREQPLRNNIWYAANVSPPPPPARPLAQMLRLQGIAVIVGSLIAYGLSHITNGALHIYQYIFLINGAM